MDRTELIDRIKLGIKTKDPNAEVFLFGSQARGDYRADSDWDILILVDDEKITLKTHTKFTDYLYDIELESGQVISTLIYPKKYWQTTMMYSPLYKNVSREGIQL
jgi:predicted nucleotidyltransferase